MSSPLLLAKHTSMLGIQGETMIVTSLIVSRMLH